MNNPVLGRRSVLKVLASGAGMALLAACGGAAASTSSSAAPSSPAAASAKPSTLATSPVGASAPSATAAGKPAASVVASGSAAPKPAAGTPKTGGTLRLGIIGDISTLDGHNTTPSQFDTTWSVFDRLIGYDQKLQPQPLLAESWDLSTDLKQITLHLRKGVTWHSGREFTSDDVKYNMLRVRDAKLQIPTLRNQSMWFTTIDTPDKSTVVLTSDAPRPAIFDFFEYFNQVDHDTMEGPDAKTKSVGTGPFKFVEWVQGDHLTFAKNANYWQTGRPYVDQFVALVRSDQAMLAQFDAGAMDIAKGPAPHDFARYKADPKYQTLVSDISGNYFLFGANLGVPPLDNKLVRQALNYALDRKRFADTFLLGEGAAEVLPWPPSSPAYEASKANTYAFDLDKAAALLKQANVGSFGIDVNVLNTWPMLVDFAPAYQADLAKIGVKLNIRNLDLATWVDEAVNRKFKGLYLSNSSFGQLEPSSTLTNGRATDPNSNNEQFDNAQYKQLIAAASSEPDANKRKALYSQINDILLDQSFIMPLASYPPVLAMRQNVHGVLPSAHDGFYYDSAWLD
ncbi:MAG TPA: ABC transporter substrate-binding protein [Chloroflexota bacterium]|nr:ABC transporter substrate-binding protein [Chloroflexota bacterium]